MLRTQVAELLAPGLQAHGKELGLKTKMAEAELKFEHFELGADQHGGKEIIGLRGQGLRRRFAHRRILLEPLIKLFHSPPSLVNHGYLGLVQAGIAADQTEQALAAFLVCKDLSGYEHCLFNLPQIDLQGLHIGKSQRVLSLKPALSPVCFAQGHGAGGFEAKDEVLTRIKVIFLAEEYQLLASRYR